MGGGNTPLDAYKHTCLIELSGIAAVMRSFSHGSQWLPSPSIHALSNEQKL